MGRPKKNSVRRDQVIIPDQHTHSYSAHFRLEKKFDILSDSWGVKKSAVIPRLYPIILYYQLVVNNKVPIKHNQGWAGTFKRQNNLLFICRGLILINSNPFLQLGTYSFQIKSENLDKKVSRK